ncbi:MAG: rod shape-determining protein [Planctomycetota bacterium]
MAGPSPDTTYLGIDLGTSRISVSASNGTRETIWSYIGYPKDHVAKKNLGGRDVIYGQEALENRLSLNIIRPLEGGSIKVPGAKDSEDARKAVRLLLERVLQVVNIPKNHTIYAVIGAPAQASTEGKATIIESIAHKVDSVIVCSEPFAVAYGLDFLRDTLVIDIGAGTTDLCRVHGTMPGAEDQVTHYVAGDAIDKTLLNMIKEKHPAAQVTINQVREFKEKYASVSPKMEDAIVTMRVDGKPQKFDITELVYKACYTIVPPTVAALQKLIATYDPEFQAKMLMNILIGGGGSQIKGLDIAIEKALEEYGGGKVRLASEPQYAGSNGALKIAFDMPEEHWKKFEGKASSGKK